MKEELRRENTIAFDHLVSKKPVTSDLQSLSQSFIRGCHAELDLGLEYSTGGKKRLRMPRVKENVIARCANVHLKVGPQFTLIKYVVSNFSVH